jgi:hypothetical protein
MFWKKEMLQGNNVFFNHRSFSYTFNHHAKILKIMQPSIKLEKHVFKAPYNLQNTCNIKD